MVEAGANEISEEEMLEALWRGHDAIRKIVTVEHEMVAELGSPAVPSPPVRSPPCGNAWSRTGGASGRRHAAPTS